MEGGPGQQQRVEGQLSKFTNVVKGWQWRWFVLEPGPGVLEYYTLEERSRCRGSRALAGAAVLPSQEDSNTFTISFSGGDSWRVRAGDARARQVWVDRLRQCSQRDQPDGGAAPPPAPPTAEAGLGEAVMRAAARQDEVVAWLERLPATQSHTENLLLLRATAQATLSSLQTSLTLLQHATENQLWDGAAKH